MNHKPAFENHELINLVFPERAWKRRRRQIIIALAVLMSLGAFFSLLGVRGIYQRKVASLLFKIESKLHIAISYDSPIFGLSSAAWSNIQLNKGQLGSIERISARLALTPGLGGWFTSNTLQIEGVDLKLTPDQLVRVWNDFNQATSVVNSDNTSLRFRPDILDMTDVSLRFDSNFGPMILQLDKILCITPERRCRASIKSIYLGNALITADVKAELRLTDDQLGNERIVLKLIDSVDNSLTATAVARLSPSRQQFVARWRTLRSTKSEQNVLSIGSQSTLTIPELELKLSARLIEDPQPRIRFKLEIDGKDFGLSAPIVAQHAIGPFSMVAKVHGLWTPDRSEIKLNDSVMTLRNDPSDYQKALRMDVDGNLSYGARGFNFDLSLEQPDTSCQTALRAIPRGLAPVTSDVFTEGRIHWAVDVGFQSRNPDHFYIKPTRFDQNCHVTSTPFLLSLQRLRFSQSLITKNDGRLALASDIAEPSPQFVRFEELPPELIKAFVHSEDWRFFEHHGIDMEQIQSAMRQNLAGRRHIAGGSTISQQTAKNLFLTHDRTISRKLQELLLTGYLEQSLNKERILELYLNVIEFGNGIFGLWDAAHTYFGRRPQDLTLKESVFLAVLLPNPSKRGRMVCNGKLPPSFQRLLSNKLNRLSNAEWLDDRMINSALQQDLIFNTSAPRFLRMCSLNHSSDRLSKLDTLGLRR